jgi:hypothetical protein
VIQQPAQRAGLQFAPGLVEQMVEETTGGDALPLLAYVLRRLYQQAGRDGSVTAAEYEALGGVVGALQGGADQITDELDRRGHGALVLPTLMKFAVVEGDAEPSGRRIPRSALDPDEQQVADVFVDARLLTSGVAADGETVVGVAHEALLRQWPPLRKAIEASRTSLRLRSELDRLAADWQEGGRDDSYLLRGARLAEAERWLAERPEDVAESEASFIRTSVAWRGRSLRRLRAAVVALTLLLVAATGLGGTVIWQYHQDSKQALMAGSRHLANQAEGLKSSNPRLAMLLTATAYKMSPTPESIRALTRIANAGQQIDNLLTLDLPGILRVEFSPLDPDLLAVFGRDYVAFDIRRNATRSVRKFDAQLSFSTFSPDGRTMILAATKDSSSSYFLWFIREDRLQKLPGIKIESSEQFAEMRLSPDGNLLATCAGGRVQLWRLDTESLLFQVDEPGLTYGCRAGFTSQNDLVYLSKGKS